MKINIMMIAVLLITFSCQEKKTAQTIDKKIDYSQVDDGLKKSFESPSKSTKLSSKSNANDLNNSKIDKYLIGDLNFAKDDNFVKVPDEYASKTIYLRDETLEAFLSMANDAKKENISLVIISGARSFDHQKSIWERKWNASTINNPLDRAKEILKYSSMPMTSRHHWGTDIDINSLENKYFEEGQGLKEYLWLSKNAAKYGFCQVYSDKKLQNRKGYEMEKWHWSYMPLANKLLSQFTKELSMDDIVGFDGSEVAKDLNFIEEYVIDIHECK